MSCLCVNQSGRLRICAAEGAYALPEGAYAPSKINFLNFFDVFEVEKFQKIILQIFLSDSDRQTLVLGDRFGNDFLVKIRFQTFF